MRQYRSSAIAIAFVLVLSPLAVSAGTEPNPELLSEMSLEDFLNTEVTSVSKRAQRLVEVPSAAYVVSSEDIRRSGATTIPDVLRMVPGLEVQQASSSNWAVSARGFNNQFSNKLLVMIDGRSVYTPLFSGVYWDAQAVPLHDIDRIEVIRGPGATVWGANAVNGVINIITKDSRDTVGNLVSFGAGNQEQVMSSFRVGQKPSENLSYRVSGQVFHKNEFQTTTSSGFGDDWRQGRFGARVDWTPTGQDTFRFSFNGYDGDTRQTIRVDQVIPGSGFPFPIDPFGFTTPNVQEDHKGGDLTFNWARQISEHQSTEVQLSYDNRMRDNGVFGEKRRTWDVDFQHQIKLNDSNDLIWGAGGRVNDDRLDESLNIDFTNRTAREALYSSFVQNETTLVPERIKLTAGSKIEWNTYTGWEIQPSARVLYTPTATQQAWASVSRAVRTPARAERELAGLTIGVFPAGFDPVCDLVGAPCAVQIVGDDDFGSEELLAYEVGYRIQPNNVLALDFTAFFNDYENLVSLLPANPAQPFVLSYNNRGKATSYGFESAAHWRAKDWWTITGSFSTFDIRTETTLGESPAYRFTFRSLMDLPGNVQLDTALYWKSAVESSNLTGTTVDIDPHLRGDVRLAWRPRPGLELALVGQNLINPNEPEWVPLLDPSGVAELPASYYGQVTWEF